MKTIARAKQTPPNFHTGSANTPDQQGEEDRASDLAFYFMMATLVLGLVYFFVLAFYI